MGKSSYRDTINGLSETPINRGDLIKTVRLTIPSSEIPHDSEFLKLSKQQQLQADPQRYFHTKLSGESGTLEVLNPAIPFNGLSWSIINNSTSLVLSPLLINDCTVPVNALQIDFPEKIKQNCHIFRITATNLLVVDLITESGILATLCFDVTVDFASSTKNNLCNVENWCYVSDPYDFQVRTPHYLHSIDELSFLVFLQDGGIVKCGRDAVKSEVTVFLFSDTSYVSSKLGKFGRFLPTIARNNSYDEDETNYNIPAGHTLKTVLDSFVVNHEYLVTITLNRKLKVWSLSSGTLLNQTKIDTDSVELGHKLIGDGSPISLLSVMGATTQDKNVTVPKTATEVHFMNYLPIGTGQFKLWKLLINGTNQLVDLGPQFQYLPLISHSKSVWLVKQFKIMDKSCLNLDKLFYPNQEIWMNIMVLLKSNTSSVYQVLTIFKNGDFNWVKSKLTATLPEVIDPKQDPSEYYINKILDSNVYSPLIIETALAFFEAKYNNNANNNNNNNIPEDLPIKEKVTMIISQNVKLVSSPKNYTKDITKLWSNFESLCQECLKICHESLSLSFISSQNMVVVNKVLDFSIVRTNDAAELLYFNKHKQVSQLPLLSTPNDPESQYKKISGIDNDNSILKFLDIITNFKNSLPSSILGDFKSLLLENFQGSVIEQSEYIFDRSLKGKISEDSLQGLMNDLNSVDVAFKIIGYLCDYPSSKDYQQYMVNNSEYLQQITLQKPSRIVPGLLIMGSFKQTLEIMETLYFDLLLMTMILKFDEQTSSLILTKTLTSFKKIRLALKTLSTKFNGDSHGLNIENIGNTYDSLFHRVVVKHFQLAHATNKRLLSFVVDDKFLYGVLNELSITNNSEIILNSFTGYETHKESAVFQLYQCLTYLNANQPAKAMRILLANSAKIVKYQPSTEEKKFIDVIGDFLEISKLSQFYYTIARVFNELYHYSYALSLVKLAIKEFETHEIEEDNPHVTKRQYYSLYFQIALGLQNFHEAFMALQQLDTNSQNYSDFKEANNLRYADLKQFVDSIIVSNDLKNLITYPFSPGDMTKVDEILYDNADSINFNFPLSASLTVINTSLATGLKHFKTVYSWRLNNGDVRGACEALYQYITKYQYLVGHPKRGKSVVDMVCYKKYHEVMIKQKSVMKDLYLNIMSLLNTMTMDDEKWVMKENHEFGDDKKVKNRYVVVMVDELVAECENLQ
ncbi:Nup120 protein [Saccharomycopsis crataegensis]|uniref:Nup120 protein n=1 Tax=Saccharomycopsis crataegensis TaxID=43959 RepID=A0AAV5QG92_9ASCO|nr:Nup120 protein [Saccharomycopsis crataegensis]